MKNWIIIILLIFSFTAIYGVSDNRLDFSRRLINDKLYDEALNEINAVLTESKSRPLTDEALLLKAEVLQAQKKFSLSEEILREITDSEQTINNSVKEKALSNLITYYADQKKTEDVITLYKRMFLLFPFSELTKKNSIDYLESYYILKEYNDVIAEGRVLEKQFGKDPINAEILLLIGRAYFSSKLEQEAEKIINEIKVKYPDSQARWKSLELTIQITEQEKGPEASVEEIKKILKTPINRSLEEKLLLKLAEYYVSKKNYEQSILILNTLTEKYNFSASYDYYLVLWMESCTVLKDYQIILSKLDFIKRATENSPYKNRALHSIAEAYYLSDEYWKARTILTDYFNSVTEDSLKLEYKLLSAKILKKQGNYNESIRELVSIVQFYSHLGKNDQIFTYIADSYFYDLKDPAQALIYYNQAVTVTFTEQSKSLLLFQMGLCYESLNKNQEALDIYNRINIENLDAEKQQVIFQKQNYLQLFQIANTDYYIKEMVLKNSNEGKNNLILVALIGWELKDYQTAIDRLNLMNTTEARIEALKLKTMLTYKAFLENNKKLTEIYKKEIRDSLINYNSESYTIAVNSINVLLNTIEANGVLNNHIAVLIEGILSVETTDEINFNNLFRFWLWKYYRSTNQPDKLFNVGIQIKQDRFIRKSDLINIRMGIAEIYYKKADYQSALENYKQAEANLNLSNPQLYYHYAFCLYQLGEKEDAFIIIKSILQNNQNIPEMKEARYMIANAYIEQGRNAEAIDMILNNPPSQRNDKDYQILADLYQKTSNLDKEKESLLFIKDKSLESLRRLAELHEATNDMAMAEYTWTELTKKEVNTIMKANAYFSLSLISFKKNENQACINSSQKAFLLIPKNSKDPELKYSLSQMIKLQIISYYKISNRPKAESVEKENSALLKTDPDAVSEIRLNEGIYYAKMDKDKSVKILSALIKSKYTNQNIVDQAYLWRGTTYYQLKKYDDAETDLLSAGNSTFNEIKNAAYQRLGTLNYTRENFDQAMYYYHYVILNDSTGVLALDAANNFAIVAKITKDWERAVQAYQWIISRWGDQQFSQETRFNIAFCYYQAKLYDRSLQIFEQYQDNFSTEEMKAEALYWIAENYFAKEDFEQSINAFLKVSYTYPSQTRWAGVSEYRAGEVYLRINQPDKARQIFEKILSKYGSGSDIGKEASKYLKTRN